MRLEKSFDLNERREVVWDALCDVRLVAECLPGATIIDELDKDRYRGRFSVKIGPLAASFDGELRVEHDPEHWTAVVSGKGADARSSSRASGRKSYRLVGGSTGPTRVEVASEIDLAGALAQFGKAALLQEVANRITGDFVGNFERHLAQHEAARAVEQGSTAPASAAGAAAAGSLDLGRLIWTILQKRVLAFMARLFGR